MLATFSERMLYTFPCRADKAPLSRRGFKDAIQGVWWPRSPLVGVPTGRRNRFDVLDIDGRAGREWLARNAIPQTRVHYTQRGCHLLFVHAPGLQCSTGRIAPGVDVKAEGGYCIWWPREGYSISDAPLSEWPDWLLAEAMRKPRREENPSTSPSSLPPDGVVAELTEALFELDPCEWGSEGSQESYDGWLALMMACKAAGISKEDWLAWCAGDECYADAGDEIGRKWDGVPARHADALFKALAKGGIRLSREVQKWRSAGVPLLPPAIKPHPNLKPRTDGLLRWLRRNATADNLFNAACLLAELGVTSATATRLISGNLPSLRKALGDAEFTYQITRAYTHIAAKGAAAPTERIT